MCINLDNAKLFYDDELWHMSSLKGCIFDHSVTMCGLPTVEVKRVISFVEERMTRGKQCEKCADSIDGNARRKYTTRIDGYDVVAPTVYNPIEGRIQALINIGLNGQTIAKQERVILKLGSPPVFPEEPPRKLLKRGLTWSSDQLRCFVKTHNDEIYQHCESLA